MEPYLTQITHYLFRQSWHIALLIAAVAAVSYVARNRSAHVRYLLWLIVLAKCLVPPLYTVPLAVLPQRPAPEPAVATPAGGPPLSVELIEVARPQPYMSPALPSAPPAPVRELVTPTGPTITDRLAEVSLRQWLALGWVVGASLFALAALIKAWRTNRWLRRDRRPLPENLQAKVDRFFCDLGIKTRPKVWLITDVGQPFVWGVLRGSIYLPGKFEQVNGPAGWRGILGHELSHVMRFDAAVNFLQVIAQAVYWFHPLVWWANRRLREEREKCCDEMAIARLNTHPKDYSTAIVNTLIAEHKAKQPVPSLAVAGPVKNIEDRIKTIMRSGKRFYRRPTFITIVTVLLLAAIAVPTTLALTSRTESQKDDRYAAEKQPLLQDEMGVYQAHQEFRVEEVLRENRGQVDEELYRRLFVLVDVAADEWADKHFEKVLVEIEENMEEGIVVLARIMREGHCGREVFAEVFFRIGKPAVPTLMDLLGDEDAGVRRRAAAALGRIGPPASEAIPRLIEMYGDKHGDVRKAVVGAIVRVDPEGREIIGAYEKAKKGDNTRIRSASDAVALLGDTAIPLFVAALKDKQAYVRECATYELGRMKAGTDEVVAALIVALGDENSGVRWHAAEALGMVRPVRGEAVQALIRTLDSNETSVCYSALGNIGPEAEAAVPALLAKLKDRNESARCWAADALGKIGPAERVVPALIERFKDESDEVRWCGIAAVQSIGAEAVALLVEALKDKDEGVKSGALHAFRDMGPPARQAVGALVKLLKDPNAQYRMRAASALSEVGSDAKEAVEPLIELLSDGSPNVRAHAASALGRIRAAPEEVIPALVKRLEDEDETVRIDAAYGLGAFGLAGKQAVPALVGLLEDENKWVRSSAITALGEIGPDAKEALPLIVKVLKDKDPELRRNAVTALHKIGPSAKEAVPALIEMLKDKDWGVHLSAIDALGAMGPAAVGAVMPLSEELGKQDRRAVAAAARALRDIGPGAKDAVPALIECLKDENERVRYRAAEALGQIGPAAKAAVPALMETLQSDSEQPGTNASIALGQIGPPAGEVVPAAIHMLQDGRRQTRINAAKALRALGSAAIEAVPALIEALRDKDVRVRIYVVYALEDITGQRFGRDPSKWQQWYESYRSSAKATKEPLLPGSGMTIEQAVSSPGFIFASDDSEFEAKSRPGPEGAREVVEAYLSALKAGDYVKAAVFALPGSAVGRQTAGFEQFREQGEVQRMTIAAVYGDDQGVLAVSTEMKGYGGEVGPLVFHLVNENGKWLIDDIDMETSESAKAEVERFLENRAEAKMIGQSPAAREQVSQLIGATLPDSAQSVRYYAGSFLDADVALVRFDLPLAVLKTLLARSEVLPDFSRLEKDPEMEQRLEGYRYPEVDWWQPSELKEPIYGRWMGSEIPLSSHPDSGQTRTIEIACGGLIGSLTRVYLRFFADTFALPGGVRTEVEIDDKAAWGEVFDGLQFGLECASGSRVYRLGESVYFVFSVRNVGGEERELEYVKPHLQDWAPSVRSASGGVCPVLPPVQVLPSMSGAYGMGGGEVQWRTLKPGEEWTLDEAAFTIRPVGWEGKIEQTTVFAPAGKYKVNHTLVFPPSYGGRGEELWHGQLASNETELEILPAGATTVAGSHASEEDIETVLRLLGDYVGQRLHAVSAGSVDGDAWRRNRSAWEARCNALSGGEIEYLGHLANEHPEDGYRAAACEALGETQKAQAADLLVGPLGDKAPYIRHRAARALGSLRSEKHIPELLKVLKSDTDSGVRAGAAFTLGNIGSKRATKGLVEALESDKEGQVPEAVLFGLMHIMDASALPALRAELEQETNSERRRVLENVILRIEESAWGEAVDGLQVRLREAVWDNTISGFVVVELCNVGQAAVRATPAPQLFEIEFDPERYVHRSWQELRGRGAVIPAGESVKVPPLFLKDYIRFKDRMEGDAAARPLSILKPGTYSVRVTYVGPGRKQNVSSNEVRLEIPEYEKDTSHLGWYEYLATAEFLHTGGDRSMAARQFESIARRYPNSRQAGVCKELGRMLLEMAREDEKFVNPKDVESLSEEEKIEYFIYKLRDVSAREMFVPGKCRVLRDSRNNDNAAAALREMGGVVVPAMMGLLEDRRPTRSVGQAPNGGVTLRYCDIALEILADIAGARLPNGTTTFDPRTERGAYLGNADEQTCKEIIARVNAWWSGRQGSRDETPAEASAEPPIPWGEAVDGVQMRVGAERQRWYESETPKFLADMRNHGTVEWKLSLIQENWQVQLDGVWYRVGASFSGDFPRLLLGAGDQHRDIEFSPQGGWDWNINGKPLKFTPGWHTVRLAFEARTRDRAYSRRLRLVSNPVVIEVLPAEADKREWGEAVGGLQCGLRADKRRWETDETPKLQAVVRNVGERPWSLPQPSEFLYLKAEGKIWRWKGAASGEPVELHPGQTLQERTILLTKDWSGFEDVRLELPPGRYPVQVVMLVREPTPPEYLRVESNVVVINIGPPGEEPETVADEGESETTLGADLYEIWLRRSRDLAGAEGFGLKLLEKYTQPDEQALIYYQLALIYAQSGQISPSKTIEYARKAWWNLNDPVKKAQLFVFWGDALQLSKERREAAKVYLRGLEFCLQFGLPEEKPERPGVSRYKVNGPPEVVEEYYRRRQVQAAAWKHARFIEELIQHRQALTGQIVQLYAQEPDAFDELHELVMKYLHSEQAAEQLLAAARTYRKNHKLSIPVIAKIGPDPDPEAGLHWGQPTEGISVRLRATAPTWRAGQTPKFRIDVRNDGSHILKLTPEPECWQVEVDGVRYGVVVPMLDSDAKSMSFGPDKRWYNLELSLDAASGLVGESGRVELTPGRHIIRVVLAGARSADEIMVPIGAMSEPVEIEILPLQSGNDFVVGGVAGDEADASGVSPLREPPERPGVARSGSGEIGVAGRVLDRAGGQGAAAVLELLLETKKVWKSGDVPQFRVHLPELEPQILQSTMQAKNWHLQIDGIWCELSDMFGGRAQLVLDLVFEAGQEDQVWRYPPILSVKYGRDDGGTTPQLTPGTHTIRFAFTGVEEDGQPGVVGVSNPVVIEILPNKERTDKSDEGGWGKPVEGLRCRWVAPVKKVRARSSAVVGMEIENVSAEAVFWQCREGTWNIRTPGSEPEDGSSISPKFEAKLGEGVRGATGEEAQGHHEGSGNAIGYYSLKPGARMVITTAYPWPLVESGAVDVHGYLWRKNPGGGGGYPSDHVFRGQMTCPALVLEVVGGLKREVLAGISVLVSCDEPRVRYAGDLELTVIVENRSGKDAELDYDGVGGDFPIVAFDMPSQESGPHLLCTKEGGWSGTGQVPRVLKSGEKKVKRIRVADCWRFYGGRPRLSPGMYRVKAKVGRTTKQGGHVAVESKPIRVTISEWSWGGDVGGLRCRLAPEKVMWESHEALRLKLEVRNEGRAAPYIPINDVTSLVEVNGTWHRCREWSKRAGKHKLEPGDRHEIELRLSNSLWFVKDSGSDLVVKPGKYVLRAGFTDDPINSALPVTHVSNAVEIEILARDNVDPEPGIIGGQVLGAEGEPIADAVVELQAFAGGDVDNTDNYQARYATTDVNGQFVFEDVKAESAHIGRFFWTDGNSLGGVPYGLLLPFQVEAGRTYKITLGGKGRPVIGRLVPASGKEGDIEWTKAWADFSLRTPHVSMIEDNNRIVRAMMKSEGGNLYQKKEVEIHPDGSFRIEDVRAGLYQLRVKILEEPKREGLSLFREVFVDMMPNGTTEIPLNLGSLAVSHGNYAAPESRGEAVAGIQCRLRAGKGKWQAGQKVTLEVDIHNQGSRQLYVSRHSGEFEVEFDGRWYCRAALDVSPYIVRLGPGQEYNDIMLLLDQGWTTKEGGEALYPAEGKHKVRVALTTQAGEKDKGGVVHAVSNPVEIEILPMEEGGALNLVGALKEGTARLRAATGIRKSNGKTFEQPKKIEFLGLDLTDVPCTTEPWTIPDWEDARFVFDWYTGTVHYIAAKDIFYVQHDDMGSSTFHYYGPFEGDPYEVLDLEMLYKDLLSYSDILKTRPAIAPVSAFTRLFYEVETKGLSQEDKKALIDKTVKALKNRLGSVGEPDEVWIDVKDEKIELWIPNSQQCLERLGVSAEWKERSESGERLDRLGRVLQAYANDNQSRYPDTVEQLQEQGYIGQKELQWALEHVTYLGKAKTTAEPPDMVLGYDRLFLAAHGKTYVIFNDGRLESAKGDKLNELGISSDVKPQPPAEPVPWGKASNGLAIRLIVSSKEGETLPILTFERFKAVLEVRNMSDRVIKLAEQNTSSGRETELYDWVIGLVIDAHSPNHDAGRFFRADDQDGYWSRIGNSPSMTEVGAGEVTRFRIRLRRLVNYKGQNLLSLRGTYRLRPVLEASDDKYGLWHGEAVGEYVPVVIGAEQAGSAETDKRIADLMDSAKTFQKQGRYKEALGQLEMVLALDPTHKQALELTKTLWVETGLLIPEETTARVKSGRRQQVRQQLQRVVDLSQWSPEMGFGDALEELKKSVAPPLNIVVLWGDLEENTAIDRTTPINMEGVSGIYLGTALRLLLRSVSAGAEIDFVIKDGVIVIATKEALPNTLETRVYDIYGLVAPPVGCASYL